MKSECKILIELRLINCSTSLILVSANIFSVCDIKKELIVDFVTNSSSKSICFKDCLYDSSKK